MASRSQFETVVALDNYFKSLIPGAPVGNPNAELTPEQKGEDLWYQSFVVPAESTPVTLGEGGEDNNPGFMQIDVNYPRGKGDGPLLQKVDQIANAFPAGKDLQENETVVRITGCSVTPGRYVGGYYRVSITVNYYTRSNRAPL